jgi:hypothetical protein
LVPHRGWSIREQGGIGRIIEAAMPAGKRVVVTEKDEGGRMKDEKDEAVSELCVA